MQIAYVIMLVVGVVVFLGVLGAVLRAVRGAGGEQEPQRRTRGARGVQLRVSGGLAAAALIIFVVGVVFTEGARNVDAADAANDPIEIEVDGQQWLWRYAYPTEESAGAEGGGGYSAGEPFTYHELVIPVDTQVTLNVTSVDVLHRWSVPDLARSVDAVPGKTSEIKFSADETGVYDGRSTEFSGPGYTTMRTQVRVVEPEEYQDFLEQTINDLDDARRNVDDRVEAGDTPAVEPEEGGS